MTASGMRKAIATIDVTAAATSASVVLTEFRPAVRAELTISLRIMPVLITGASSITPTPRTVCRYRGPRGGLAELAAQPRDVHVDGLVVAVGLMPHLGQQLPAGDDRAGPRGQVREQVELAARELKAPAVEQRLPPGLVDAQPGHGDDGRLARSPGPPGAAAR